MALMSCQKEDLHPTAYFSVFPSFGDSRTVFFFDATKSADQETVDGGLMIRWDWEGDSIWDTPFSLQKEEVRRFEDPGWYYVTMEVKDHSGYSATFRDTINIWSSSPETGKIIDSRDGLIYKTVKFNGQWLMSENLRYGTWLQDTVLPSQNKGAEFYLYDNDRDNINYGGLYTWYEAMNYRDNEGGQGICPEGWHIPTFEEWNTLFGFSHYIGFGGIPINIHYYFGESSPSGMEVRFCGYGIIRYPSDGTDIVMRGLNETVGYWSSQSLSNAYVANRTRLYTMVINLSKYEYGAYWSFVAFDPFSGKDQRGIDLNYLRCFQD